MNTKLILVATVLFFAAVAFATEEEKPEENEIIGKEADLDNVDEEDLKALMESDVDDETKAELSQASYLQISSLYLVKLTQILNVSQKSSSTYSNYLLPAYNMANKLTNFIKSAWAGLSLVKKYGDNYRIVDDFIRYLISDIDN
ncbi:hypothetical protein TrispH2_012005 [Trichoplax sp. H2]|nr:hypothetical protein TrispH2_012005 [Trichoplax sp. H2]|eukprot:RDD36029.1 hypothetical protein TrispH2_012005 [Trichoplax sp. H2]